MEGYSGMIVGAATGVVGVALLFFESIRALTGSSFNLLATILLYGGLSLVVLTGVLLTFAVVSSQDATADLAAAQPPEA